MDGRKNNGNKGHSTKSKKKYDRRKKISVSDNSTFNEFFEDIKTQMAIFYERTYSDIINEHIRNGKHYVYMHYYKGEVVYIGKGKNDRYASQFRIDNEHSELIKKELIDVSVVANNLDEDAALLIEKALIKLIQPKYNIKNVF